MCRVVIIHLSEVRISSYKTEGAAGAEVEVGAAWGHVFIPDVAVWGLVPNAGRGMLGERSGGNALLLPAAFATFTESDDGALPCAAPCESRASRPMLVGLTAPRGGVLETLPDLVVGLTEPRGGVLETLPDLVGLCCGCGTLAFARLKSSMVRYLLSCV